MLVGLRSRRHIAPFILHRPAAWAEAASIYASSDSAAYMAGGLDLIDRLKQGHAVSDVILLDHIAGFASIEATLDGFRIGAGATHAAIAAHEGLPLAPAWSAIASPRVRHVGTIGGNVMAGNDDYDGLPALLACGAEVEYADGTRTRLIGRPEGLVAAFHVPRDGVVLAERSLRPALTVWLGTRVAIGMAYAPALCVGLDELGSLPEPIDDERASSGYRRRMIEVLVRKLSKNVLF